MHGPPCAFNQIRVSPGSRHGLPWAFLSCYTQGGFCLPSISVAPFPVAAQDACCLLDVEAFICLYLTGSHKKIMWLEPTSIEQNGPPGCSMQLALYVKGTYPLTCSCNIFIFVIYVAMLNLLQLLPDMHKKQHWTIFSVTLRQCSCFANKQSTGAYKELMFFTGHREKQYHYFCSPLGHFWRSTPGHINFKESMLHRKKPRYCLQTAK